MSEKKPATTRKYKLIVGDLPATPKTKTEDRPKPPVQDDGWQQAARGSKPGDRYVRNCRTRKTRRRDLIHRPTNGNSHTTWTRFRAWLRAHRF